MQGTRSELTGLGTVRSKLLVTAIALCALAACSGSPAHLGTYALESVDGRPLPVDVDSQRMVSAEITLGVDGHWTLTARHVALRDPVVRDTNVFTNEGRYTVEGEVLTLRGQSAADTTAGTGTLSDATITSTEDGHVMVYRRRSSAP